MIAGELKLAFSDSAFTAKHTVFQIKAEFVEPKKEEYL